MAYPPPLLPINRTDATPQQTAHAADHNAIAAAINDTTAELGPNPSGTYANVNVRLDAVENYLRTTEVVTVTGALGAVGTGIMDVVSYSPGTRPYDVLVAIIYTCSFGYGGGDVVADCDLYRWVDGGSIGGGHAVFAHAGYWTDRTIMTSYSVPAGANPGCKGRITMQQPGWVDGSIHAILKPLH